MKRSSAGVCSFLVMWVGSVLSAQVVSESEPIEHIATVSFTVSVLQTEEGQREFGALQKKYAPRQAQIQTLTNEVESMRKQLSGDGKLADADRLTREKLLDSKEKQLQRETEDFRNDSQADSQQVYQKIAQKMFAFLQVYTQRSGLSMVIDRGSDAAPVVWYAAKGVDVTDDLIRAYNTRPDATPETKLDRQVPAQTIPEAPSPH